MVIVVVDECLEISDFYLLAPAFALKKWIQLKLRYPGFWEAVTIISKLPIHESCMRLKQSLYDLVWLEFIISDAENLKSLLASDESTLNP